MGSREIEIRLKVEIPWGADISTVDRLIYEAGREATAAALKRAAAEESEPENYPGCGKKGQ
jgi:hypothetical protein